MEKELRWPWARRNEDGLIWDFRGERWVTEDQFEKIVNRMAEYRAQLGEPQDVDRLNDYERMMGQR